ncbi:MAG: flavodoxin family protein [Candidatus Methanomethylophilaceae archaeon]|nr:flavodoxin family protein [Candidatus Methanomethylophilaceae archaeon]MDD3378588.1 flavodoxin family protein [Candidatus Methanomethylophilaceae archaeon]MDY0224127.1 flavodoxin family protein [Candidatus Methanomethylophilaceae archaeon]
MSKIVAIVASARKNGNSDTIVKAIAEKAKANGNTVSFRYLNDFKCLRGCQACLGCKKAGRCVLHDEISDVLEDIRHADGVILSAPCYFGQPSAQYRILEDRMFSFLDSNACSVIPCNKKLAVVITCSGGVSEADAVAKRISDDAVSLFKYQLIDTIVMADGVSRNAAANDAAILAKARDIGSKF